ncbi:hypothetical protein BJ170DRAFT_686461 [Xylariales sp. AK1849]|nr:hypothetical protein BJ170DRAFT_686461 [Xylariales sp. AK1849]
MRDPRLLRVTKVVCTVLAVWASIAWISGLGDTSLRQNLAPPSMAQDDQSHSTQLILPSIQRNPSSSQSSSGTWSRIAKVAMFSYNNVAKDTTTYENALRSHKPHNDRYGYLHYVLRCSLISVQYSKPAYVLSIILQELVKPPCERLDWLVWHDADLVLMNSEIPLEAFLPPPEFDHIHLIVTNDLSGLNSGVFFIRVNEWSVSYLTASLSYKSWDPNFPSMKEEQAIMDGILQRARDYPIAALMIKFRWNGTGSAKTGLMREWMERKAEQPEKYNVPFLETNYPRDIARFWENEAPFEAESQKTFWHRLKAIQDEGPVSDRAQEDAVEKVKASMQGGVDKIHAVVKAKVKQFKKYKIDHLRAAEKAEVEAGEILAQ